VDLQLYTYTEEGEVENDTVKVQLKATDSLPLLADGRTISFAVLRSDLEYWLEEWTPIILVVYDAVADNAYWLYLQAHFQQCADFDLTLVGETVTVRMSTDNVVNPDAIRQFARFKARVVQQFEGIRHETI